MVIEVPAQSDQIDLPAHPRASVTWIHGGNGVSTSRLDEIVTRIEHPEGIGYVWVAGESRALRGARRHLRRELGLPHTSFKAVGYWIDQAVDWLARYDALEDEVRSELDGMWTQDRDEDEIEEEYDERLTALGL